jgi:predicted amidophosphoribosyltransferase
MMKVARKRAGSEVKMCPVCGGSLKLLGALGWLVWVRCENCGAEFSIDADVPELDDCQEQGTDDDWRGVCAPEGNENDDYSF